MRNWYFEDFLMLGICLFFIALIALPVWYCLEAEQYKCEQIENTDIPQDYNWLTGCRVQRPNGMWTHVDDYYMIESILED